MSRVGSLGSSLEARGSFILGAMKKLIIMALTIAAVGAIAVVVYRIITVEGPDR